MDANASGIAQGSLVRPRGWCRRLDSAPLRPARATLRLLSLLAQVADLIHCSEQFPELPYARVVVHFVDIYDREGSEYDVVPGSELEVSRVAYRDSSSKYFVNGKPSNFTEVRVRQRAASAALGATGLSREGGFAGSVSEAVCRAFPLTSC
jgi:nucleotide-binding universal stress UspA family protein